MDRDTFNRKLEQLLTEAELLIPAEAMPDLPGMTGIPDVPAWHEFEMRLWEKGEQIRQLLLEANRKLNDRQADRVLAICTNANAGRGRESFIMLLGKKCYVRYGHALAGLLSDPHAAGHAVDTLYKMGAAGYASEIAPFAAHHRTWIRNAAKRYLQKYT